jgi:hypothetical protein
VLRCRFLQIGKNPVLYQILSQQPCMGLLYFPPEPSRRGSAVTENRLIPGRRAVGRLCAWCPDWWILVSPPRRVDRSEGVAPSPSADALNTARNSPMAEPAPAPSSAATKVSGASLWLTDAHKEDLNVLASFPTAGACVPSHLPSTIGSIDIAHRLPFEPWSLGLISSEPLLLPRSARGVRAAVHRVPQAGPQHQVLQKGRE